MRFLQEQKLEVERLNIWPDGTVAFEVTVKYTCDRSEERKSVRHGGLETIHLTPLHEQILQILAKEDAVMVMNYRGRDIQCNVQRDTQARSEFTPVAHLWDQFGISMQLAA